MTKDPEQVIVRAPLLFPTATDVDTKEIKSRAQGRLKSYGVSIDGTNKLAADLWVSVMIAFNREQVTFKMIDGYLSASQDGDNQGLVWFGDLLLDQQTTFVFSAYNRSGETIKFDNVLVIER